MQTTAQKIAILDQAIKVLEIIKYNKEHADYWKNVLENEMHDGKKQQWFALYKAHYNKLEEYLDIYSDLMSNITNENLVIA